LREPGEDGPADASTEEPAAIADADRAEEVAAPTDATGPRDAGETEPAEPVGSDATADTGQEAEKAQSADVRDLPHSTDAVGPGREAEDTQPTSTAIHISEAGEGEPVDAEPPEVGGSPEAVPSVPGSSAIVGFDWEDEGGHWFNAVNENGSIKAIDGQSGQVEAWPPSDLGLGFSAADMKNMEAVYFDANGRVVK